MIRLTDLKLELGHATDALERLVHTRLGLQQAEIARIELFRRNVDARKAQLQWVYAVDVELADPRREQAAIEHALRAGPASPTPDMAYRVPVQADGPPRSGDGGRPVVVGFGPCGIFAALMLARMGLRPIVLERGRSVRERTRDTWGLWRRGVLQPESNVQFGEGGAGTFSDGKLWSQIKDPRFLGRQVMRDFVQAGAPPEILVEAHPHIGTFKLVKVVEQLRAQLLALGGEIRFGHRMAGVQLEPRDARSGGAGRCVRGLEVEDLASGARYELPTRHLVLALGHSARDSFAMLFELGVAMQAKPFSIGFRIEHPQGLIDRARWGRHAGHPALGAAEYRLVHHAANGRSVYSFCMCPGGTVVAATSEAGRVVTNGMSQYSRNERNANAGMVVGIDPRDYPQADESLQTPAGARWRDGPHPLSGVVLQRRLESEAYRLGQGDYRAPAQRLEDFLQNRASASLGSVEPSYKPGVTLCNLDRALPDYAIAALREALPVFGRRVRGFDLPDAVLTGVETRTSSPLRILRGDDFQSINVSGLYPAGEGAGYAGGILSAGVDGIRVAEAVGRALTAQPPGPAERLAQP